MFTGSVPELYDKLREVREENLRHSQLVTARYLYPTLTDVLSFYVRIRFVDLDPDSVGPVGLDPEKPVKKNERGNLKSLDKGRRRKIMQFFISVYSQDRGPDQ